MKQLIEEYFAITGRPMSTMSVSEYLEFRGYAETRGTLPAQQTNHTPQKPEPEPRPARTSHGDTGTPTARQPSHPAASGQANRSALDMLRSVSG